jgi:hypothetical protein
MVIVMEISTFVKFLSERRGCANHGNQVAKGTGFDTVTPNVSEFSVINLLRVTLWQLEFRE